MATISRHRSGWQAKIRRQGFPRLTKTFDTRKLAEGWVRDFEGQMDARTFIDRSEADQITLAAILTRYLLEVIPRKRGADSEASRLKVYFTHPSIHRPVSVVTPRDMAALRDWRLLSVSPGTVLREFCILRHALEVARREWFLPITNPIKDIRLPPPNAPRERRLRIGEGEVLLSAARAYDGVMPLLIEWFIETAMRREEAATVLRANVTDDIARLMTSKNGRGREVPLSLRAAQIVDELPLRQDGRLFGMRPDSITQAFRRICNRAGISGLHVHDLRHEATSRFVELGLSMPEVMAITGHRDPRMMLRYYQPRSSELVRKIRAKK